MIQVATRRTWTYVANLCIAERLITFREHFFLFLPWRGLQEGRKALRADEKWSFVLKTAVSPARDKDNMLRNPSTQHISSSILWTFSQANWHWDNVRQRESESPCYLPCFFERHSRRSASWWGHFTCFVLSVCLLPRLLSAFTEKKILRTSDAPGESCTPHYTKKFHSVYRLYTVIILWNFPPLHDPLGCLIAAGVLEF